MPAQRPNYNLFGGICGIVVDNETSEPLSGALVMLSQGGKTFITGGKTDNDNITVVNKSKLGRFEFLDLDAQQYTITVQKSGYSTNGMAVTVIPNQNIEVDICLTALAHGNVKTYRRTHAGNRMRNG